MQEIVGIRFKPASQVYYFLPPSEEVSIGDKVLVETTVGLGVGTVALIKSIEEITLDEPLKKVVRKLTKADEEKLNKLKDKAISAKPIIEEKIEALKLQMKVVDVEYSFDESKVTIEYTSEGRVDFRELLKVLASTLKTKIELRQISGRDEVKVIGGMGICGRPCCCSSFLKEPAHISVKMAKLQNISMNPAKTGGLCGRMMCCMSYEDEIYKTLQKENPKQNEQVKTPDGEGIVTDVNLIKSKVSVKIIQKDGSFKIKEFDAKDLEYEGKPECNKCQNKDCPKQMNKEEQKTELKPVEDKPTELDKNEPRNNFKNKKRKFFKYNNKEKK